MISNKRDKCFLEGKVRSSNLELYRIICMLMIIAHHFVINSGLIFPQGPMLVHSTDVNTFFLQIFGMWGKTGINCFLLITGYFMCKSTITLKKFLKLIFQIYLYKIVIFGIFACFGYEIFSLSRLIKLVMPVWGINQNFTSCFLIFWLSIPFWNILVQNMTKRQHQCLLVLLLGTYTILGSIPHFHITFNYVTWFGIIYLISSYIRMYPHPTFEKKKLWATVSILSVILAVLSMFIMIHLYGGNAAQFFVSDSNKFFAVVVAVSSFLWFKGISLPYNKWINIIGGSTFGVLLIHANSNTMRTWLWRETVDCIGHYSLPLSYLVLYSISTVCTIFMVCVLIDRMRVKLIEKPFFLWYDHKIIPKLSKWQIS